MQANLLTAALWLLGGAMTSAQGIVADANAPKGRLPDVATPSAYRLDFTILPESARFTGHDEIDITLKGTTRSLYLHGRDLTMNRAVARVGGNVVEGKWTQVDKSGTVRL